MWLGVRVRVVVFVGLSLGYFFVYCINYMILGYVYNKFKFFFIYF